MFRHMCALLCAILVVSLLNPIEARKGGFTSGRHSYPRSGGLSGGGGGHHYPSSGGLSGNRGSGGSHGYPSSGGLSGGSHGYPASGGLSGGGRGYPSSSNTNGYPSNGGLSGGTHQTNGHSYPPARGTSGNTPSVTNVHHHYHYSPPQQIKYTPVHGGAPVSYPVYHGTPPTYVYQYRDSGSKYGTLLTGLALLNLGTLAGGLYANSRSHSQSTYKPQAGEICKLGIRKENGDYEETKIDCQLITSFIFAEEAKANTGASNTNTTVITTTVTNVTVVNTTNAAPEPAPIPLNTPGPNTNYTMLSNGTLVPMNETVTANATAVANETNTANNAMTSSVVSTITNTTTVTNALDVKGKPLAVTPSMKCYVIRNTPTSNMRKTLDCALLQTYAEKSLKPNSAMRNMPTFTAMAVLLAIFVFN